MNSSRRQRSSRNTRDSYNSSIAGFDPAGGRAARPFRAKTRGSFRAARPPAGVANRGIVVSGRAHSHRVKWGAYATVAQLVEQPPCKRRVGGSSPSCSSTFCTVGTDGSGKTLFGALPCKASENNGTARVYSRRVAPVGFAAVMDGGTKNASTFGPVRFCVISSVVAVFILRIESVVMIWNVWLAKRAERRYAEAFAITADRGIKTHRSR